MNYLKNTFVLYGVILILLLGNIGELVYITYSKNDCPVCEAEDIVANVDLNEQEENVEQKHLFVDIKGYVKNPGVYGVEEGAIVNDLINLAGGVKSGGTTDNINLSKKLVDEATIVVSSKTELKKLKSNQVSQSTENNNISNEVSNFAAIEEPKSSNDSSNQVNDNINKKISLNNASKEELMTLSGVGEKTAEKIIEYRTTQKFTTIEDIKNVSGIGDSVFEKIKDFITI